MAVTEHDRFNAYKQLVETLGEEVATTLMEMLPSTGWADVATKTEMNLRFEAVDLTIRSELAALRAHMDETFRKHLLATIGVTCTIVGLVGAAARFL